MSYLYLWFQALQKLASQYLKRDWPGINPDDQRTDYRCVCVCVRVCESLRVFEFMNGDFFFPPHSYATSHRVDN